MYDDKKLGNVTTYILFVYSNENTVICISYVVIACLKATLFHNLLVKQDANEHLTVYIINGGEKNACIFIDSILELMKTSAVLVFIYCSVVKLRSFAYTRLIFTIAECSDFAYSRFALILDYFVVSFIRFG